MLALGQHDFSRISLAFETECDAAHTHFAAAAIELDVVNTVGTELLRLFLQLAQRRLAPAFAMARRCLNELDIFNAVLECSLVVQLHPGRIEIATDGTGAGIKVGQNTVIGINTVLSA